METERIITEYLKPNIYISMNLLDVESCGTTLRWKNILKTVLELEYRMERTREREKETEGIVHK